MTYVILKCKCTHQQVLQDYNIKIFDAHSTRINPYKGIRQIYTIMVTVTRAFVIFTLLSTLYVTGKYVEVSFYSKYLPNLNITHHCCYPGLKDNHFSPSLLHSSPTRSPALHFCPPGTPCSIFYIVARVNFKKSVSQIPLLRTLQWLHITQIL